MGESAAETVREIEETRDRLEGDLRELEQRLPAPAVWGKRLVGVIVGGGVAGTALMFAFRRVRKSRQKKKALEAPVNAVVQVLPERWAERVSETLSDGQWKPWAVGAGAAWGLFKLAELRQLRRLNRALIVGR